MGNEEVQDLPSCIRRECSQISLRLIQDSYWQLLFILNCKAQKRLCRWDDTMQCKNQRFHLWDQVRLKGTWRFNIKDDDDIIRTIEAPNTMYCKSSLYHHLSPQHWSQESKQLSHTYCTDCMQQEWLRHRACHPNLFQQGLWKSKGRDRDGLWTIQESRNQARTIEVVHLPKPCLFGKIRIMTQQDMIPKRLTIWKTCESPTCTICIYGKSIWQPSRRNGQTTSIKRADLGGQCMSFDTLTSMTKGFVAQIKGCLTITTYTAATVCVDHYLDLSVVYMQEDQSRKEFMKAKVAFELHAKTHGV